MKPNSHTSQRAATARAAWAIAAPVALWVCTGAAWAQSGQIIVLREVSPRIATQPAATVEQTGPVRTSVYAGREDLIEAGVGTLLSSGGLSDAALGAAVSRPIRGQLDAFGRQLGSQVGTQFGAQMGAPTAALVQGAQFAQPVLSLTHSLGGGMAASVGGAAQSVGSQVQQATSGIGASVLSGVMP